MTGWHFARGMRAPYTRWNQLCIFPRPCHKAVLHTVIRLLCFFRPLVKVASQRDTSYRSIQPPSLLLTDTLCSHTCQQFPILSSFSGCVRFPLRPPCLDSINFQRILLVSECVLYLACKLWPACACRVVRIQQCGVCLCMHALCSPSLFPCSCAPLNMSDVLERDITTGAQREASSLSSPLPPYITTYWHQSLLILLTLPPSPSPILPPVLLSLFLNFTFPPFLSVNTLLPSCDCSVCLFSIGFSSLLHWLHCLDDVAKFKVQSSENQQQ